MTLRSIAHRLELDPDTRELTRLTDAYLEPWTRYRRLEELHSALRLALRVGSLGRALAWHRFVSQMESPFKDEYADAVAWGLQRFLNDELLPASW